MPSPPAHNSDSATRRKLRLYGRADSAEAYELRDFLSRSVVQYDWVELAPGHDWTKQLGVAQLSEAQLPIVDLPNGERLFHADVREVARHLGWISQPQRTEYDLSIYGAGPAGLSAAVYGASEGLSTVLIERAAVGGQAGTSSLIENYLGFPAGISGAELAENARQQAVKFGAEILLLREGISAEFKNNKVYVNTTECGVIVARANICATGVEYRRLKMPNEDRLLDRGVYYGAGAGEAQMCAGDHLFVVGGGNSAGQAVMNFSRYAAKVTMIVRGGNLSATLSQYLIDRITSARNVEVLYNSEIVSLDGEDSLRQITIRNKKDGTEKAVGANRLFICIGGVPNTEWAKTVGIMRDPAGYLITGPDLLVNGNRPAGWPRPRDPFYLETSVPGCFAAGDVRHNSVKRVASAVGEGAMAVTFVHRYLSEIT